MYGAVCAYAVTRQADPFAALSKAGPASAVLFVVKLERDPPARAHDDW